MENTITVEIPRTHVAALLLIIQRLDFDDCYRQTDGHSSYLERIEQAYDFINAIGVL